MPLFVFALLFMPSFKVLSRYFYVSLNLVAALTDFCHKFPDRAPLVLERKHGVDFARCGQMRRSEGFI